MSKVSFQKALTSAAIAISLDSNDVKHVIVLPSESGLHKAYHQFCALSESFKKRSVCFPSFTQTGVFRFESVKHKLSQRITAQSEWLAGRANVVFTDVTALMKQVRSEIWFHSHQIKLKIHDELDPEVFLENLDKWNYQRNALVDEPGMFSFRGHILDFWPSTSLYPVRMDVFGDSVNSLRYFRKEDQRSFEDCPQLTIFPAREFVWPDESVREIAVEKFNRALLSQKVTGSARVDYLENLRNAVPFAGVDEVYPLFDDENIVAGLDFFTTINKSQTTVWFIDGSLENIDNKEHFDTFLKDFLQYEKNYQLAAGKNFPIQKPSDIFPLIHTLNKDEFSETKFQQVFKRTQNLYEVKFLGKLDELDPVLPKLEEQALPDHMFASLKETTLNKTSQRIRWIESQMTSGKIKKTILLCKSLESSLEVASLIDQNAPLLLAAGSSEVAGVGSHPFDLMRFKNDAKSLPKMSLKISRYSGMFGDPELGVAVVSEDWLRGFGNETTELALQDRDNSISNSQVWFQSQMGELVEGDLVVHVQYGVARFCGLKTIEVLGIKGDFLELEYAGGDKVYVAVQKMNHVQRYVGSSRSDDSVIDSLKSKEWEKKKTRAKEEALKLAKELMAHQAKRASSLGYKFSPIGDDYIAFESAFPYEESIDQLKAIRDINTDMSTGKSMDRLLCGDVGFGKTEVAMRAAYRCVLDGLQVAWLVPTTVLAHQHTRSLLERFADFGVKVTLLDRSQGAAANKALEELKAGQIDILIGTHRILSKDIQFKNLGLLIVDEEQRFGVLQKEKIKTMSYGVDVLTMTATPIPRTLQMAMLGLRDLSLLTTAPKARQAVRTFVCPSEDDIISNAIIQELERGGQLFFVHNRVEELESIKSYLQKLVPKLRICVGHGKMGQKELEEHVVDFISGKYDMLLCTTIIESGIDMPNVNTILIQNAQNFGLAQLYQLRGRVGRRSTRGYCYFLTLGQLAKSDEGYKRLEILKENQGLGSGFVIASQDLELRGAGSLLGDEQSGKIADVGLETYSQMLDDAMKQLGGIAVKPERDVEINLPVETQIPEDYIGNTKDRVRLYRKFFASKSLEDISQMELECLDRYGPIPQPFKSLIETARIRVWLIRSGAVSLAVGNESTEIKFSTELLQNENAESAQALVSRILDVCNRQMKGARLTPDGRVIFALKRKQFLAEPEKSFMDLKKLLTLILGERV